MKKQVLTIDFKADQGVILGWNYSDLSRKPKFFRHLLVLNSGDVTKAQNFLENYIKLIKPGDLFATIYKTANQQLKFKSWSEKTYGHSFITRKYINLEGLEAFRME